MAIKWLKSGVCFQVVLVALAWSTTAAAADADRAQVEALVKKFWSAEVARDYGAVWELLGPAQQSANPRTDFITVRTEKGPINILAAEVKQVEVAGDLAWAHVKYDWVVANFPGYPTQSAERWQQWRHTDRWAPLGPNEAGNWPLLPPQLRPLAEEARISQRAAAAWKAKVDQDWKAFYQYMSPAFKAAVPIDEFLKGRSKLLYVSAKVDWVEAKESEAKARVTYTYKENEPAMSKMKPLDGSYIEPWIKAEGSWYLDAILPEAPPAPADAAKQAATGGSAK